jgi:anti-anti-sigma regulatory factor
MKKEAAEEKAMGVSRGRLLGLPAVILSGEIDRAVLPELEPLLSDFVNELALARAMGQTRPPILLDFSTLTFADSSFIALMYDVLERLPEDGWVGAVNMSPNIARIFELAGLLGQPGFKVFAGPAEVAKALAVPGDGVAAA